MQRLAVLIRADAKIEGENSIAGRVASVLPGKAALRDEFLRSVGQLSKPELAALSALVDQARLHKIGQAIYGLAYEQSPQLLRRWLFLDGLSLPGDDFADIAVKMGPQAEPKTFRARTKRLELQNKINALLEGTK